MSEAIVLLTYPLKESDLIVSFLTRDVGKLRGVARRARRPKSGFGAGLGRLAHIRASYFARENRELVNLDSCDLLESQFGLASDYWATVALDYFAEIAEQLLPAQEPNEKFFRLLLAVLEHMRTAEPGAVWRAALYYTFWAVRLAGIFPELRNVSAESRALAGEIAVSPIAQFSPGAFEQNTAADLRRFLVRQIEDLTERKIKSYAALTARVAIA